jgi:hypothetical protein
MLAALARSTKPTIPSEIDRSGHALSPSARR